MDWIAAGFARLWLFSSASCLFSQPWALETFTTDWAVACRHFSVYMASSLLGEVAVAISPIASLRPRFIQAQMHPYYNRFCARRQRQPCHRPARVHPNFLDDFDQAALAKRLPFADQRLLCTSPKAASIRVAPSRLQL